MTLNLVGTNTVGGLGKAISDFGDSSYTVTVESVSIEWWNWILGDWGGVNFDFETMQDDVYQCDDGYVKKCSITDVTCSNCTPETECSSCKTCINCKSSSCGRNYHQSNLVVCQSACEQCEHKSFTQFSLGSDGLDADMFYSLMKLGSWYFRDECNFSMPKTLFFL